MIRSLTLIGALGLALSGCGGYAEAEYHTSGHYRSPDVTNHPGGERYQNYGTNPYVSAEEDNLVTFSIDVDTGSYTLMRRDVSSEQLPNPDGVRVEEFVNFFDYKDATPQSPEEPLRIHTEVAPSPFGAGKHLMRVALKGMEIDEDDRPPANLVFLVDVSGSMQAANKMGLVRYSLTRLTETLNPDDQVAIVTYAGSDTVLLPPTPISERHRILSAIDGLVSGGGTNGAAGIRTAYDLAEQAQELRAASINRVILCSDGDFNVGVRGDELLRLIERNRDRDISLSVFGFGRGNYNDRDMEQMADRGNGNYAFIDREVEAERVLVKNISGTLVTIAKDAKIQVVINSAVVERYRLIGYENRDIADEDFRDDDTDAGELGVGHTVTAFIELELKPGVSESQQTKLGEVIVRYKSPDAQETASELVSAISPADIRSSIGDASQAFRLGAAVVELAEILRHSDHVDAPDFDAVIALASAAIDPEDRDQSELLEIMGRIQSMWP